MIGKLIAYFSICILATLGLQGLTPEFTLLYLMVCLAALIVGGTAIVLAHRDRSAQEELRQLRNGSVPSSDRR